MEVEYLNTDLEIQSSEDLSIIVEEFGKDVHVLFNGQTQKHNMACFEADYPFLGADEAVSHLCLLIENLSPDARKIWDNCVSRIFDLGYQSGDSANCFRTELRTSTVSRVAAIGASIVITVYPTGEPKFDPSKSNG